MRSAWASMAGEGSWQRPKLSHVLTKIELLKRGREILEAEYISCIYVYELIHTCVWAYTHMCTNAFTYK